MKSVYKLRKCYQKYEKRNYHLLLICIHLSLFIVTTKRVLLQGGYIHSENDPIDLRFYSYLQ